MNYPEPWANASVYRKMKNLEAENARLKAEVERLTVVIGLEQKTIRNLQQTPEWSEITRLTAYCRDLQAEVERLNEDNRQLKKAFEIAEGIIKRMGNAAENAAKEGKPSV
jgi:peptidoglycan hydrolase CwlO-like protein